MLSIVPTIRDFIFCIACAELINALSYTSTRHVIHFDNTLTEVDCLNRFQQHGYIGCHSLVLYLTNFGALHGLNHLNFFLNYASNRRVQLHPIKAVDLLSGVNNLSVFLEP